MSELKSIQQHLERHFNSDGKRIVFWHDEPKEYIDELFNIELDDVTIVQVENNEYALKYRMLKEEPKSKFLIYRPGQIGQDIDNWLLDLELAHGVFTADKRSLILQDFGGSSDVLREVIDEHSDFFRSAKRKEDLKERLAPTDDLARVKAKMVAILIGEREHLLKDIWRNLLVENAEGNSVGWLNIEKFGLADYHWQGTKDIYGYCESNPSVDDFVLWLFKIALDDFRSDTPNVYRNLQPDFNNLKYDSRFKKAYKLLSRRAATALNYDVRLEETDLKDLGGNDLFESIDKKIISELSRGVANRTISAKETSEYIQNRRKTFWFEEYSGLYTAIDAASSLLSKIDSLDLSMQFFNDGFERYTKEWYQIDQFYRQFLFHARASAETGPLEQLKIQIEGYYQNKYLSPLGLEWQKQVDSSTSWFAAGFKNQTTFFKEYVQNSTVKKVVIISDALRYEIAEELGMRIRQEDKFEAELEAMLGVLPSYTQLGMAALLPHSELRHADGEKALVDIDGKPTSGTANRNKILEPYGGIAIQAEDFHNMDRTEQQALTKDNQIVYIYHNRIDKTGDNISSEARVFDEVEDTFEELISMIKKLANANASNILVTADHGFLYQHGGLDESSYLSVEPHGDEILYRDRRFILGKNLKEDPAFKTFKPQQVGLGGNVEIQIPKSTHRLRRKGSGSRFVHGGATLQEIVVPVLSIKKKRKTDVSKVEVEILPETDKITTGQIAIKLFQVEPISPKVQTRTLTAGLYVNETLISNLETLEFSHTSEDKRDRYQTVNMILNMEADVFNGRTAEFKLIEKIGNTNQTQIYNRASFQLKRSFMTDF